MPSDREIPDDEEMNPEQTQLDRIESMLVKLLEAKKPKARKAKKHLYGPKFEEIWPDYPKVAGANKQKAYAAYKARLKEAKNPLQLQANIHIAVIKYAEFCAATGRYVMLPATFFGPDQHYMNDWTIPAQADTVPKEQIHASYKDYDPNADTTSHLDTVDPYSEERG